jgi:quinol-cytochrome oxidoreductase complex cytochrome b subunit
MGRDVFNGSKAPVGRPPARENGTVGRAYRWLDERYGLTGLQEFLAHKTVPITRHFYLYYFGGVALFLFVVQVLTGILLLMYYRAGPDSSYESVRFLITQVQFGWLIRSIHSWSANLMVLAALFHMFSVYFTRAYRRPRELTWVTGFLLLVLSMGFGFSGYLLPWNELALFATKVGTDIVGAVPLLGHPLMVLLRGGKEVSGATLSRFFGIHVAVLPGLMTVLLAIHLLMIQRQGMAEPDEKVVQRGGPAARVRRAMPFFPNFMLRDLLLWIVVLNIIAVLAVFFPWDLGQKADPFASAPAGIRPEWYFLFMFQTLKFIPAHIFHLEGEVLGILAFGVGGLAWLLLPFLDRGREGKALRWIGILLVTYIVVFTVLGWVLS